MATLPNVPHWSNFGIMDQVGVWGVSVMSHLDIYTSFLVAVGVIGLYLAFFADDSNSQRWAQAELFPDQQTKAVADDAVGMVARTSSVLESLQRILCELQEQPEVKFLALWKWLNTGVQKIQHMGSLVMMSHVASSKRQLMMLGMKRMLKEPIKKDETLLETYVSLKDTVKNMGMWTFMWEVEEVRSSKVICSGISCHPMSSYSYMNFIRDERVQNAAIAAANKYATGNHGPRMLGGNNKALTCLEKRIAEFYGRDGSMVMSSGFLACMSTVVALVEESDLIIADRRCHSSLRTGMKVSGAKTIFFRHNNFSDCERHLRKHRRKHRNCWMIIESIYSMEGTIVDLPCAYRLAKQFRCKIIMDEAHGLGILGKTGRGAEEYFDMPNTVDVIVGTFSKSLATVGGFICGDRGTIEFMDFHALGVTFSAPLPAYCAGAALCALEVIMDEPERVTLVQTNSRYLRRCLETGVGLWPEDYPESLKYELEGDKDASIVPVVFPDDPCRCVTVGAELRRQGWMVAVVLYPACPLRRPRFRITATTAYTRELMEQFTAVLVRLVLRTKPTEILSLPYNLPSPLKEDLNLRPGEEIVRPEIEEIDHCHA